MFEMLVILSGVAHLLGAWLFNPKLMNAGTGARKPNLYLKSSI
jgi:hypothetical protein